MKKLLFLWALLSLGALVIGCTETPTEVVKPDPVPRHSEKIALADINWYFSTPYASRDYDGNDAWLIDCEAHFAIKDSLNGDNAHEMLKEFSCQIEWLTADSVDFEVDGCVDSVKWYDPNVDTWLDVWENSPFSYDIQTWHHDEHSSGSVPDDNLTFRVLSMERLYGFYYQSSYPEDFVIKLRLRADRAPLEENPPEFKMRHWHGRAVCMNDPPCYPTVDVDFIFDYTF